MQIRLFLALLMMVSSAMAVFPVWRSPIISSRCPRPIGIMLSIALRPVDMGSRTPWRSTTPGSDTLDRRELCSLDGAAVIDRLAKRVDHAANHPVAHRHAHDLAAALDLISLAQLGVIAQDDAADLILVEVHGQAFHAVGKLQHLSRHGLVQAVEAGDSVAQRNDGPDFIDAESLRRSFESAPSGAA